MATIQFFFLTIRELVRILRALSMKYTAMIARQAIAVLSKPVFSSFYPQPSRKKVGIWSSIIAGRVATEGATDDSDGSITGTSDAQHEAVENLLGIGRV
jgi:hypothetical protein